MHVFLVWKRRYADVRAGTQAPPLRFRLDGLRVERLMSFGQIVRGRLVSFGQIARGRFCWLVKTVHMNQHHRCCTFVSPGLIEHSEIYPGESRGGEPMPSALYFLICALTFCKIYPVVSSPCKMPLPTTLQTTANVSIFTHRTPHFISLFS